MCYRTRRSVLAVSWTAEPAAMLTHPEMERGWRFREAALPHLNAVYTMARYMTRDTAEAEYAVQECFVRGLRRFDWHSGDDMKPWLLGILRYFCKVELRPRGKALAPPESDRNEDPASAPELVPPTAAQAATVVRILPASTSPATLSRSACCSAMSAVCIIERGRSILVGVRAASPGAAATLYSPDGAAGMIFSSFQASRRT
jgi:Sigma-70 region 2